MKPILLIDIDDTLLVFRMVPGICHSTSSLATVIRRYAVEERGMPEAESMARMGKRLFHEDGNMVGNSRYEHIQEIKKPIGKKSEYGYISQNPKTGQTVIKSIYKK